jgi:2-amino-4-hydroxy-6-hydroxymethyldihydropteridine diphosphokinase
MPSEFLIALGSSLGNRIQNIQMAIQRISELGTIEASSKMIETEPEGGIAQNRFMNSAVTLTTDLTASPLMLRLLQIEADLGRIRSGQTWSDRVIDIDLILEKTGEIVNSEILILPHPRFHERSFVLIPAAEIAPQWIHPSLKCSILELKQNLTARTSL